MDTPPRDGTELVHRARRWGLRQSYYLGHAKFLRFEVSAAIEKLNRSKPDYT
jgi:hypothetical protein